MMKELSNYFDHYTIHARLKPAFFVLFPLVVTVIAWFPFATTAIGSIFTLLITFGVMTFLSLYVSDSGNNLQDKLYSEWGGAPTTLILMPDNESIDQYTKARYFRWINSHRPELGLPETAKAISEHPDNMTQKIRSAVNFLREYSRDKKQYSAVYRDNVAYGFTRNVLALKSLGIVIVTISALTNVYMTYNQLGFNIISLSPISVISLCTCVIYGCIYIFFMKKELVERRAFRYAQTLFEVCESDYGNDNPNK